jgi:hypothetical protein
MSKKRIAKGTFDVNMKPLESTVSGENGIRLGRQQLTKSFDGDLEAESAGEMLTAFTSEKGSAGYVAIEQAEGNLHGKAGSFVLQHYGLMHSGEQVLILEIVPDSGTDELSGISGKMEITVAGHVHNYILHYDL